jgi:hypothetical protein
MNLHEHFLLIPLRIYALATELAQKDVTFLAREDGWGEACFALR